MTTYWIIAFWTAAGVLGYVLLGYPLTLMVLGLFCRRREPGTAEPTVTLVIPVHNEEAVIEEKLENSLSLDYPRDKLEIVVASDGSTDGTVELARSYESRGVRVLDFPQRRGKAAAMADAVRQAAGEVVCLSDANVIFRPDALKILAGRLAEPDVGAASGQVRIASDESSFGEGESFYYRVERQLQLAESRVGSLMGVDGGMNVLRRELFGPLPPDTILDDFVLSVQVMRRGYRVAYEPRAVAGENGTPAARQEWRRRVRIAAGAVQSIKRGHWPPLSRPVLLWQYLSHKALRWTTPVWLGVLLLGNAVLWPVNVFYRITLAAQLLVYLSAGLAAVWLRYRETRAGGIPFYFTMSNLAMAWGLVRGLLNRQPVTWDQAQRTRLETRGEELTAT